ncbi:MAG: beta-lactamase family protein [Myxococcales bacterium]|nr:beta-lactamase family protein [Myxococcales bacterium]
MDTYRKLLLFTILALLGGLPLLACQDGDELAADRIPLDDDQESTPDQSNPDDDDDDDTAGPGISDPAMNEMLQALVDEYVIFSGDPGMAMGVWLPRELSRTFVAGQANLETGLDLAPDMRFRVGSNTKMFVAAVIVQLAEEGLLSLDDPITDYLPDTYSQWEDITIEQLLRMESGIAEFIMDQIFWAVTLLTRTLPKDPEFILSFVADKPLIFEPGSQCSYCDTNYIVLGMILEAVTGNDAASEIENRIIKPLGLKKTFLDMKLSHLNDLAHGYADIQLAGAVFGLSGDLMAITALIPPWMMMSETMFDGTYLINPTAFWTAGAMISYPEDLNRFMKAFMNGELFGPEMVDQVRKFRTCDEYGEEINYSIGIMARETPYGYAYGHGGKHFGYSTDTYYLPDADFGFSFLHNWVPDQNEGLMDELWRTAMGDLPRSRQACRPPEGFFPADEKNYVHFRIKGVMNDPAEEEPLPAIAYAPVTVDDAVIPFYGLDSTLTLEASRDDKRLRAEMVGPNTEEGFEWREVVLEMDEATLTQTTDGYLDIGTDETAMPFYLTLEKVRKNTETRLADKRCVIGVPDWERASRLYLCEPERLSLEAGQIVRLFGRVAVKLDEKAVTAYLERFDRPSCVCATELGEWEPCE